MRQARAAPPAFNFNFSVILRAIFSSCHLTLINNSLNFDRFSVFYILSNINAFVNPGTHKCQVKVKMSGFLTFCFLKVYLLKTDRGMDLKLT